MEKNKQRRQKYIDDYLHHPINMRLLLQCRYRLTVRKKRKARQSRHRLTAAPTLYLHITNTLKAGNIYIKTPDLTPRWHLKLHKKNYIPFIFKELSEQMLTHFRSIIKRRECPRIYLTIARHAGFIKFPLRSLLWALRSARPRHQISHVFIWLPRAHGQRTLKKVARRKKSLQRLRARIQRRAH